MNRKCVLATCAAASVAGCVGLLGVLDGALFWLYISVAVVRELLSEKVAWLVLFVGAPCLPLELWPAALCAAACRVWLVDSHAHEKEGAETKEDIARDMLDHLSQMIYVQSLDHATGRAKFVFVSGRCHDIFGVEAAVALSDSFDLYYRVHPDDKERFLSAGTRAITDRANFLVEIRILDSHGQFNWIRIKSKIQPPRINGQAAHAGESLWFGVCDDITDMVKKRSELCEEKSVIETLEAVLSVTFDVTLYVNADYRITKDSGKLLHFLGITDHEAGIIGRDFRDFISDGHLIFEQYMARCMSRPVGQSSSRLALEDKVAVLVSLVLAVADDKLLTCEIYSSALPWPLEGNFLIGIKAGDSFDLASDAGQDTAVAHILSPLSPSTAATDEVEHALPGPGAWRPRLLKVGLHGNLLRLAARVGETVLLGDTAAREQFFAHASVGEIEEALAVLPLDDSLCWRTFVLLCIEFGQLDVLLKHRARAPTSEAKLLGFLAVCELILAGEGDDTVAGFGGIRELHRLFAEAVAPGGAGCGAEERQQAVLLRCMAQLQFGVVCDDLGDEHQAAQLTYQADCALQTLLQDAQSAAQLPLQLRGLALHNLFVLSEDDIFYEQMRDVVRRNPDVAFPEGLYDMLLEN